MRLKLAEDIDWQDLPKIEHPFFATSHVRDVFFDDYASSIWGIDEVLPDNMHFSFDQDPEQRALDGLLEMLERGDVFLIKGRNDNPLSPMV
jgi:hypothetical protein